MALNSIRFIEHFILAIKSKTSLLIKVFGVCAGLSLLFQPCLSATANDKAQPAESLAQPASANALTIIVDGTLGKPAQFGLARLKAVLLEKSHSYQEAGTLSADQTPPEVAHTPIKEWDPGKDLPVKVKVSDPSGIERIVLYYRQTRQALQYSVITMQPNGSGAYSATIPGDMITTEFDLMYYFEAVDKIGNGIFHPDPDTTDPHLIVKVNR